MAGERNMTLEQTFNREEQELKEQMERLGLDPVLEHYPDYRGSRKYGNANLRRYGISGDVNIDPTQLELMELNAKIRNLIRLLPPEKRLMAVSLLDLSDRAFSYCTKAYDLSYGWGLLEEMKITEDNPQLAGLVDQKRQQLPENVEAYRAFYGLMAGMNDSTIKGQGTAYFRAHLDKRLDSPQLKQMVNKLLEPLGVTIYDVENLFAEAADRWKKYQEIHKGNLSSLQPLQEPGQDPVWPECPAFEEAVMDVQEYMPGLIDPFLGQKLDQTRLTMAQKGFAVQNFDRLFQFVFPDGMRRNLASEGKDIFDYIYIEGRSMNELWEEEYAKTSYTNASEQMKCRFMEAALSSKKIQVLVPAEDEEQIIPFQVTSSQERLREAVERAQAVRPESSLSDAVAIHTSQQALNARSQQERDEKRRRIESRKVVYPDMDPVPEDDFYRENLRLFGFKDRQKAAFQSLLQLGRMSGKIITADIEPEIKRKMIWAATHVYEDISGGHDNPLALSPQRHPIYKSMGIVDRSQLFFIDGQPVYEYVKAHEGRELDPNVMEDLDLIRTEIMAAITSCEHRVEMAKVGMDEYGVYQIGVVSVQPDLKPLDGLESWHQRKPSSKAEDFYRKDKNRQQRISDIRRYMGEKLVIAETRRLRVDEDAYRQAKNRFAVAGRPKEELKALFGEENISRLKTMEDQLPGFLKRNDGEELGSIRTLAQILTLADYPDVRFADLADPGKYGDEKRATAGKLMTALEKMLEPEEGKEPDLQPMTDILVSCISCVSNLNLKKEIGYALGTSDQMSDQELENLMDRRSPEVTEFLCSLSQTLGTEQDLEQVLFGGEDRSLLEKAVSSRLNREAKEGYMQANRFLMDGMTAERLMSQCAREYLEDPNQSLDLTGLKAQQAAVRHMISKAEKMGRIPGTFSEAVKAAVPDPIPQKEGASPFQELYGAAQSLSQARYEGLKIIREGVQNVIQDSLSGEGKFFDDPVAAKNRFEDLDVTTIKAALGRGGTLVSLIRLFALNDDKVSFEDIVSANHKSVWKEKAAAFEHKLKEHMLAGVSEDKRREAVDFYGHMYAKAANRICKETVPDMDWSDPGQVMAQAFHMHILGQMAIDYSQSMDGNLKTFRKEFVEAYDPGDGKELARGEELYQKHGDALGSLQFFVRVAEDSLDSTLPLKNQAAAKYCTEQLGEIIRGRKISDLHDIIPGPQIWETYMIAMDWIEQKQVDDKTLEDYLSGTIKEWKVDSDQVKNTLSRAKQAAERLNGPARTKISLQEVQDKIHEETPDQREAGRKKHESRKKESAEKNKQSKITL